MLYKNSKCLVCGGDNVVLTYSSDNLDELFIESDGSIVFSCPPYDENNLTILDIKKDSEKYDYDVYFSCYDCEDEADMASIIINDKKYTNPKNAFLKIMEKFEKYSDFDPYREEIWN